MTSHSTDTMTDTGTDTATDATTHSGATSRISRRDRSSTARMISARLRGACR